MKRITHYLLSIAVIALSAAIPLAVANPVFAGTAQDELCRGSGGVPAGGKCTKPGDTRTVQNTFEDIANTLIFFVGAIAVIMLIIGGLRYVLSGGDNSAVTSAKNTILYALVGVVVAFAAWAIVDFIVRAF